MSGALADLDRRAPARAAVAPLAVTNASPPSSSRATPAAAQPSTAGPLAGTIIRLQADLGTLGRRSDNTYVLAEPPVSRVHARLSRESGVALLTDLASSGGTRINQALVTATTVLRHGDQIDSGSVAIRFEDPRQMLDGDATTEVVDLTEPAPRPALSPRQP